MSHSVIALVNDPMQAEIIVDALNLAGFTYADISLLTPDVTGERDLSFEKHSKAPEGTSTGAGAGVLLGGSLGLLASIGALAIPGVGPFIAAGPLMGGLAGAAVGGAVGGVAGGMIGLGIPEIEAKQYESKLREGFTLISVHAETSKAADRAKEIIKNGNAQNIGIVTEEGIPHRKAS